MKKILSLTSIIFLFATITPSYFNSYYCQKLQDDNPRIIVEPVQVADGYLYTYDLKYGGSISISLTNNFNISRSGQLADKFSSIRLPNFIGDVYLFSKVWRTTNFDMSTNLIPYSIVKEWKSTKQTIINKSEDIGGAHIDGRILANMILSVFPGNHIILSLDFYYSGTSWATQKWAHVWFNTGNVVEFVKR